MKKRSDDQWLGAFEPDQQAGHGKRMNNVWNLRSLSDLTVVCPGGQLDRIVESRAVYYGILRHNF
jgi:hypothetical protein